MRLLLVSTYELGHQPLHLASPAAALLHAGHEVSCLDLAVEAWDDRARALLAEADGLALSVPMHTAMRLALQVARAARAARPELPICLYGLYAPLGAEPGLAGAADRVLAGEYEPDLLRWADEASRGAVPAGGGATPVRVHLGRSELRPPARHLLPPLSRYARLRVGAEERLVGAVEASHGCAERCRHCPVPVVYDGRTRVVGTDLLLADVEQLWAGGARHLSFADPDFLNGPHHARRVVGAVHGAFPELTFDCTVKVTHILRDEGIWPSMAASGCLFVVSALESTDDRTLHYLDKGHTAADAARAVGVLASAGIALHPSWLPFTPWTTADQLADLVDFAACNGLVDCTDAVQYSIRLLVPPGSLLLGVPDLAARLEGYDAEALTWTWRSADPELDRLQAALAAVAERAAASGAGPRDTWGQICSLVAGASGRTAAGGAPLPMGGDRQPRMSEPWFCCAEPTASQLGALATPA
ncbi:MAG: CUAEP/CCAEP-tail radical SAM (seleno)protein [Acidimicrobiales bacterium]